MYNWFEKIKIMISDLFKSRAVILIIVFCMMSSVLVHRAFTLQIIKGQDYLDDYKLKIQKTKEVQGTRGRILDRNGVVLADNKLAYSVTIEDNGDYSDLKEKNHTINETIGRVIEIVESNGDSIISNFKIVLNDNNEYEFTMGEGVSRYRFLADIFGYPTIDKLSEEQKNLEAKDIIDHLCTHKTYGYGLDQERMSKEDILKRVNIRYAMSLNRFQKYVATTIASDVSEETTAAIMENIDTLQGVNITEESLRQYNDSKYFASIIGYTGQISQSEYDSLADDKKKMYSKTDIIGKSGIEQVMDEYLQGKKGEIKYYVNNVGKVIDMTQIKEAGARNDLYLTIDAKLQKVAYDLIEEKLAGILLLKIQNVMEYDRSQVGDDSDVVIPIGDVYNAFFSNEVLDFSHFEKPDAGETEQAVYSRFLSKKELVLSQIREILTQEEPPVYKDCSKEVKAYQSYIVSDLLTKDVKLLQNNKIDKKDEVYIQWQNDESISLKEYLNYALSKNWMDTSILKKYLPNQDNYSNITETYDGLVSLVMNKLAMDLDFDKIIYKYMILNGEITGTQICMMLYEQKLLPYSETQYQNLASGGVTAYDFIRGKIETLDITPGQLGLEPCTGSVVVTNPKNGEVLACVSYPGYDNNRLANTMDSAYYNKLLNDKSAPLYNSATQERTAPGSTYKPLTAIAGLTEGVINTETMTVCTGEYGKAYGSPKCWVYPHAHGSLSVRGAIEHSCNSFFYEVGYRLGLTGETTQNTTNGATESIRSDSLGLEKLKTYAQMFGLGDQTGIEVPESDPKISDEDSIRSAIGQGKNDYTTAQLARYIAAVANKGTVYQLSLLDKVVSVDGKLIKDYTPEVKNKITEVSPATWNAVHDGMRAVVSRNSTYQSLGNFEMSGKTGTAQQSRTHANHGLFVGFAPSGDPEAAFAVRIKNGYQSAYASQIGRDLMRYYYNLADVGELVTGRAAQIQNAVRTD